MPDSWENTTYTNLQSQNMLGIPIIFPCVAPVCPLQSVRRKRETDVSWGNTIISLKYS